MRRTATADPHAAGWRTAGWRVFRALLSAAFAALLWAGGCVPTERGNTPGEYVNPLYVADYPDPDVVRVGSDFYMVTSSFPYSPGLPIYHSRDLVHWRQVGNVQQRHHSAHFDEPRHGDGVYAPSIRHHDGTYYVYYGDPDFGIVMSKAPHPEGPWSEPKLIVEAKGWIDPTPLWDDDGQAYLIHAYAKSRAGVNSLLVLHRMSPDGEQLLDEGTVIYDGTVDNPIIEGPKFYKRDGYYYIFSPAGSVPMGWETVLRSRDIYGPYEVRKVFAQGRTPVNGPHQGAWVELESGESWFLHFQDEDSYGRILHLNPMSWTEDGWPVIGLDPDGDGVGEPVLRHRLPDTGEPPRFVAQLTSDEFNADSDAEQVQARRLSPQWRWHANWRQEWFSLNALPGHLRLHAVPTSQGESNLVTMPNTLTQRFPDREFTVTAAFDLSGLQEGDMAGFGVTGDNYAALEFARTPQGFSISSITRYQARGTGIRQVLAREFTVATEVFVRLDVKDGPLCDLSYSVDGRTFIPMARGFKASKLRWVGASVGLYATTSRPAAGGHLDVDWVRFQYTPQNPM